MLVAICSGSRCCEHRQHVGGMRIWDALQQWLCTPSDPRLMNARSQRLIILDPRMCFTPYSLYVLCQLVFFLSAQRVSCFAVQPRTPPATATMAQTRQQSCTALRTSHRIHSSSATEDFASIPNSILAQIFIHWTITRARARLSRIRNPDLKRQTFPFYSTSLPERKQLQPFTLAPICRFRPASFQTTSG